MKEFIKKIICKNMIKFLIIYKDSIEQNRLRFKKDIDMTIYFEVGELIKYIEEKERIEKKDESDDKSAHEMQN